MIFHFAWDCLSIGQLGHASKAEVFRVALTTYFFAIRGVSDCHHKGVIVRSHISYILEDSHGSITAASLQHQGETQLKVRNA